MNKLSSEERAKIPHLLCEGMSIRVTRLTGASKNTVAKLPNDAGAALGHYQDRVFRDLNCERVQVDEIWSFTYAREKNVAAAKAAPEGAGDTWRWTAIDADTKPVFAVLVGERDQHNALTFIEDVADRVAGRIQISSDGLARLSPRRPPYVWRRSGLRPDRKVYGSRPDAVKGHYSLAAITSGKTRSLIGNPDPAHISTSYVERQNLTMRMHIRRFTRLTNGFSKKVESHVNAVSLHFAYYNFARIHKTLKMSPAMAAGVETRLWEMSDLVAIVEAADKAPGKRGPYKTNKRLEA